MKHKFPCREVKFLSPFSELSNCSFESQFPYPLFVVRCAFWYHLYNFSRFLNCTNGTKPRNASHFSGIKTAERYSLSLVNFTEKERWAVLKISFPWKKFLVPVIEQQELTLLHKRWLLRRTKDMIADQLPEKGMFVQSIS